MISPPETDARREPFAPLESYVVRIYRRSSRLRARLTGTVEIVADGTELRFNGLRELERILIDQQRNSAPTHDAR